MKKITLFGRTIPALVAVLITMGLASAGLLTYYGMVIGTATVEQSVKIDAIESTWKYNIMAYTEGPWGYDDPIQFEPFNAVGGDEQDVWLKLSNYAEIAAPIKIVKTVKKDNDPAQCDADIVTFYEPQVIEVGLCYKEGPEWICIYDGHPSGTVYYTSRGPVLTLDVYLEGLDPAVQYQIALNGRKGLSGNEIIGNNCLLPNAPASGFTYAWECGMWGDEGFYNFEMEAKPEADGTYYGHYQIPLGDLVFNDVLFFDNVGIIVKYAGNDARTYIGPWTPVAMETDEVDFEITQVCGGELIPGTCENGVTTSDVIYLQQRPFIQNPLMPSEAWYCVRNYFELAIIPGTYNFDIQIIPTVGEPQ